MVSGNIFYHLVHTRKLMAFDPQTPKNGGLTELKAPILGSLGLKNNRYAAILGL
jgi:hypothetical protein